MKNLITFAIFLLLIVLSGCVKQSAPNYPPYPIITSVVPDRTHINIQPGGYNDSFLVNLSFTDGLGSLEPANTIMDTNTWSPCIHTYDSLLIADPFWNIYYYEYHASHITTDSCLNTFQVANHFLNYPNYAYNGTIPLAMVVSYPYAGTTDTLVYSFFIKDHAGKISNRVRTVPIIIN